MNIDSIIEQLNQERLRIDGIIKALEALQPHLVQQPGRKRGRKFMDTAARREVSERMRRYWAERRERSDRNAKTMAASAGGGYFQATQPVEIAAAMSGA